MEPGRQKETKIGEEVDRSVWRLRTIFWLFLILVMFSALMLGLYRMRSSTQGPFRAEYDGRIVDKWAGYSETDEGSRAYFRFLVEDDHRTRFTVSVSADIFERARVGMRVKKSENGIELRTDESKSISVAPSP